MSAAPDADRTLALRQALGAFATGVTVVTVTDRDGARLGVTANSFASLSLQPPLILWNLQRESECRPVFDHAERFAVNVLSAAQQRTSARYAQKDDHVLDPAIYRLGDAGCPLLHDAHAWFECAREARHDGGDHVILIGRVLGYGRQDAEPLIFHGGQYRELR